MYDIAIIGAGPAGSTLARLLAARYRVLLVDRRRLDLNHELGMLSKPCGGLLAPAAQAELARLGLGVPERVLSGPQVFAVRTVDLAANLERLYQRFYINIDREAFDRWLVSLVPPHTERVFGWSLQQLERDTDASFLRFRTAQGGSAGVRARLVIGADGAGSLVRRLACEHVRGPESYVALQARFESLLVEPYYGAVFDQRLTDYYGWTVPKADGMLVGAAFRAGSDPVARFDRMLERLREHALVSGPEVSRHAARLSRPRSLRDLVPGADGVLLAGEAAGFVSPSSGEGISYALASARALALALEPGIDGALTRYRLAVAPTAVRVMCKAVKGEAIYGTVTRRAIMRSGLGAIQPAPVSASTSVMLAG